jgi:hypothetical protein
VVPQIDQLADLKDGGKKLIGLIPPATGPNDLDKLQRGLNSVLGHVEKLIAKRAALRKTGTSSNGPAKPASTPAKKVAGAKRKGDLRGAN